MSGNEVRMNIQRKDSKLVGRRTRQPKDEKTVTAHVETVSERRGKM